VSLTNDHVLVDREAWVRLIEALGQGDLNGAVTAALSAQVPGEFFVLRETDVLAAQGLFSYAANIRTAVEFTQQQGLCVMTDEVRDRLTNLANDVVQMGCDWEERLADSGATIQPADYGIMDS
jgi:hypothetical protein